MSIYCSIFDFDSEHSKKCARMSKHKSIRGVWDYDESKPCTCGTAPILYQGSHILPSNKDQRKGDIGIAAIPDHITRDGRDDHPEEGKWYPWLRVHLWGGFQDSLVLDYKQVAAFHAALGNWLERADPKRK